MGKQVLITVGTTKFEGLIKQADKAQFVEMVKSAGYDKIVYQIGRGEYIPKHGQHFRLSHNINQYYDQADLIITHGGAGTLLQNLHKGKTMIAVANDQLLGNHQVELIEQLSKNKYILAFNSTAEMATNYQAIALFANKGPANKYKRPERCIMNQIIFAHSQKSQ